MLAKISLFVYIVGISKAVFIDTSLNNNKDFLKSHKWQTLKVFHPPSSAVGYKYEPYAYPKYEFEYSVSDKKSGDHKHHHEARDGDRVRGEYSLVETDGSLRKVQYHADDHNGFNAIVSKLINKHGDHAVSFIDHTRFFYPVGHNVKINHYFPGKDYHYQNIEIPERDKAIKPVHEETSQVKNDDNQIVKTESDDKFVEMKPLDTQEQTKEEDSTPKSEIVKAFPISVIPAISAIPAVSVMPEIEQTKDDLSETVVPSANSETVMPSANAETGEVLPYNELSSSNNDQKVEKEVRGDSQEASSYFHSKFYYIGY